MLTWVYTQVFIVYLQYYTAKYDFETDFGDWSKHWKMTESEWERYQIFVNYFHLIFPLGQLMPT